MTARMKNPALIVPGAMQALLAVGKLAQSGAVSAKTLNLVYIRASQINGCCFCLDMHAKEAERLGETAERLWSVAGWRESPHFDAAERAALELTEYATRIADRSGEPIPNDVYARAAEQFDEAALASLVLNISMINFWNRMNVVVRTPAGAPLR
jgi:AhpD family alkylhydroperoxidase